MGLYDTLRTVKDTYSAYTGKHSIDTSNKMNSQGQMDRAQIDRGGAQNSPQSHSCGPANTDKRAGLRSALRQQQLELKREVHRHKSLEGNFRKLNQDHAKLQSICEDQKREIATLYIHLDDLEHKHSSVLNTYVRLYARKRGIRARGGTYSGLNAVLEPMLEDAMRAMSLQGVVDNLQKKIQTSQSKTEVLEKELAKMHDRQIQTQLLRTQVYSLQNQVHALQQQLLTKVDKVRVVSDDEFAKDFRSLATMIRSLSRSVRVTKDTDLLGALDIRGLLIGVSDHQWDTRARKKVFVEAWVWSVILEMVFKTPFTILGSDGVSITDLWFKLFGSRHCQGWPVPVALCESWRCMTIERAIESTGKEADNQGAMKDEDRLTATETPQKPESAELQTRSNVAQEIGARMASLSTATDFTLLSNVVEAAFALALKMSLQQSRLQVTIPQVGDKFDSAQMSSLPDPDGDDREEGYVAFTLQPGLTKWGDAHGKNFDQRYDIVPSLVHLQAQSDGVMIKPEPI